MSDLERHKVIKAITAQLAEHFEHIQVLVSWNENQETHCIKTGVGNWYARQGMAHAFITEDVAQENARQVSDAIILKQEMNEDEDEEWGEDTIQ